MKSLFVLPFTLAVLAGCAGSNDTQTQTPQASADCSNLSGAALVECQKQVEPTSQTGTSTPFKMVKPKPTNGKSTGAGGNNASVD